MRPAILAPIAWSFAVWYGGEGLGMLLTGQASSMTGAPGAVLLYGLLGAAAYPVTVAQAHDRLAAFLTGVVQLRYLRRALAGFWGLAAALQLQPYWWQPNQIAGAISAMEGQGTLNGVLFGSSLRWLAHLATGHEIVLNVAFLLVALGLAIGLVVARPQRIRPLLMGSIALSLLLWWTEGCGQLFTGSATDVNTGPLLMLLALACWPAARSAACSLPAKRIA